MRYFRHEVKGRIVSIWPFVCWHIGAPQSDEGFIKEMVARVKDDPTARWIYMGDGGECVTRYSKGEIFHQSRDLTEQAKYFAELVKPIRAKGLFGIKGNHGARVYKETGMEFDDDLCLRAGIPYLGQAAFWQLVLKRPGTSSVAAFDIFTHHGIDSGVSIASKVNKAKALEQIVIADAILSAHSHICCEVPPRHIAELANNSMMTADRIRWRTTHEYICGCAYDSRTGYAESKGYPPILPAHIAITFELAGKDHERRQSYQIFRRGTE